MKATAKHGVYSTSIQIKGRDKDLDLWGYCIVDDGHTRTHLYLNEKDLRKFHGALDHFFGEQANAVVSDI